MKKIKILQINKFYYPVIGGIERLVQQIAEGLTDSVDMKVLVCQKEGKSYHEKINNVEIIRASSMGVAYSMPISLDFFRQFNKLKQDRDILHIHMPFPLADVAVSLFGFKGKIVLSWHSDIVKQKKLEFFYRPFLDKLLQRANLIVVATKGHIDGSDYLNNYKDKCLIIPYGVDSELLRKSESSIRQIEEDDNLVRFLFVGRLAYYKGCDVLIAAFKEVTRAELFIIGTGPLEQLLKEQISSLGMENRVFLKGSPNDDELAQTFADCDVLVLPSIAKSEAFGLVQIEAMAYGMPVINTWLPSGVPYVSLDGQTGLTVPPSNVQELSKAMQRLVDDKEFRAKLGQQAYKRVRQEFSMEHMLNGIHDIYKNL